MEQQIETEDRLRDFTTDFRVITLSLIASFIGIIAAIVAYVLVQLINLITNICFYHHVSFAPSSPVGNPLGFWVVLLPVIGGLIVGLMAKYGSDKIRGHGIPEALDAILIGRSKMDVKVALLKPASSAIAIGTGGPFGVEGPIIMTGGAFGSLIAQFFNLSAAERKTLLVAGASAGMAAIFSAPVAAVLLAIELLLFEWKPRSFIPVACAAIVAGVMRTFFMGTGPLFPIPAHAALNWEILGCCLIIGLLTGAVSGILTKLVYGCEDFFMKLPIHWMWWPALGGIIVGIGGYIEPKTFGVGYDVIHSLLEGHVVLSIVIGILIIKAIIWAVALGSGTSGGVLAPLLIVGGAFGGFFSRFIPVGDASLWALIGMGAMLGSTIGCPFTAVVFMVELTHDTNVFPGLLIGCVAADAVTILSMRHSILTERLARRGRNVMREYIVNPLQQVRVDEVMNKDVCVVNAQTKLSTMLEMLSRHDPVVSRCHAWPLVNDQNEVMGIITRGDLLTALESGDVQDQTVSSVGAKPVLVVYPDELIDEAIGKMVRNDVGRLPVVDRANPRRLIGMVERSNLMDGWSHRLKEDNAREPGWLQWTQKSIKDRMSRFRRRTLS